MAFLSDPNETFDILSQVFIHLPFDFGSVLACVSRRTLALEPFWKPDLLLYSWGGRLQSGHQYRGEEDDRSEAATVVPLPKLLDFFYSTRPERQVSSVQPLRL